MGYSRYEKMSESERITAVRLSGRALRYFSNSSEAVCMAAVMADGHSIQYIKNPSEAVCLAALEKAPYAFLHIKNPSEAVCIDAVERLGQLIYYIKKPSKAVKLAAVKSQSMAINILKPPLEDDVVAIHLLYYPRSVATTKEILDRAPEILEAHCAGLGDVYTIGLSIGMSGEELSGTMIEWTENQQEAFHP